MRKLVLLLLLFAINQPLLLSQGIKEKTKLGFQIGTWKPGFNEINNRLKELQQAAIEQNIHVDGNTEINGTIDVGMNLSYHLFRWFCIHSEIAIWKKKNNIRLHSQGITIDLVEKFTLVPILLSGLVTITGSSNTFSLFAGGGGGIVFVKSELPSAFIVTEDMAEKSVTSSSDQLLVQFVIGMDYRLSNTISLFGKYQFLMGEFSTQSGMLGKEGSMNVSLTGYKLIGGIQIYLGGF